MKFIFTYFFHTLTMMATKRRFFFSLLLLQMVQAIQVLRFHLLELEKVSDYEMKKRDLNARIIHCFLILMKTASIDDVR